MSRKIIRVVKFDRGQNDDLGLVVEKLGFLVEEGGVVFVALDNKLLARAKTPGTPEIVRHAPDQETRDRVPASTSICAINEDVVVFPWVPAITTDCFSLRNSSDNSAGKLVMAMPRVCAASDLDVIAPTHVAHNHTRSGSQSRFSCLEASEDRNALLLKLRGHGRIHVFIRSTNVVARPRAGDPRAIPCPFHKSR